MAALLPAPAPANFAIRQLGVAVTRSMPFKYVGQTDERDCFVREVATVNSGATRRHY
jgi:hypothetical protein